MTCGKDHLAEMTRDLETRMKIMYSAQQYATSAEQLCVITDAEPEYRQAFLHGVAKAAQQKLSYALYGHVGNHFSEKVFTKAGLQQPEMVKLNWG